MATQSVKDILNTEIPKPSFVLSPSVPAPLPSGVTVTRNGQDNVARTLDPYSGKFEHVPEDTPRVYSSDQSLLVEAAGRTNKVLDSSDPTAGNWSTQNVSFGFSYNLLENKGKVNSRRLTPNGSSSRRHLQAGTSGGFTGNTETIYWVIEKVGSNIVRLSMRNGTSGVDTFNVDYDFTDNSFTENVSPIRANSVTITDNGPNGGKVVKLIISYSDTAGDQRLPRFVTDPVNYNKDSFFHHCQIEEAPSASSPIVTGSSANTRAGDEYAIFEGGQPDWWNPNEGTIFTEIIPTAFDDDDNIQVFGLNNNTFKSWGKLFYNTSKPVGWTAYDGTNGSPVGVASSPFSVLRAGVSIDGSQMVASANGQSNIKSYNGNLLSTNTLTIGEGQREEGHFRVVSIRYYPHALPESTLNILTT